jgi:hypothetical protein
MEKAAPLAQDCLFNNERFGAAIFPVFVGFFRLITDKMRSRVQLLKSFLYTT